MSNSTITVPSWTLPLILSLGAGLTSYGATQANADATANDLKKLRTTVEKTVEKSVENGTVSSVNSVKIDAIMESLKEQKDIQSKTQKSIEDLVKVLISQQS